MKSVGILGCGPAGLMAAHAATLSGWDFRIYSRKRKSPLYGSQYLHQPIPGLDTGMPKLVQYVLRGTAEQYRRKVYGDSWDGTVSPDDITASHDAWDIRHVYQQLWDSYEGDIVDAKFHGMFKGGGVDVTGMPQHFGQHDLIISTVPRKIWAQPGDVFESQKIWALGDTELPRVDNPYRPEPFTVVCEAEWRVPWYRVSNVFGYCTMEWPNTGITLISPAPGASLVEKPLRHNSTAASDMIHMGRYGAWEKGILSHEVYFQSMKVLADDRL